MTSYTELVAKLRSVRKEWNLTHSEVGELTGRCERTIQSWESQNRFPCVRQFVKWADALGVDLVAEIRK